MSNAGLGDYFESLRARDAFDELIVKIIDRERPKYKYATVISNDYTNDTVTVEYPDDPTPVVVQRGNSQAFLPGDKVRINGRNADRYVDEGHSGLRLIQEWSLAGSIYISRGGDWPYIMTWEPKLWVCSLTEVGSSTTTVRLLKNGTAVQSLSFASGEKIKTAAITGVSIIALTDFLATDITVAGTGAKSFLSQVYGK